MTYENFRCIDRMIKKNEVEFPPITFIISPNES